MSMTPWTRPRIREGLSTPSSEACRRPGAKGIRVARIARAEASRVHDSLGSVTNQERLLDAKKGDGAAWRQADSRGANRTYHLPHAS